MAIAYPDGSCILIGPTDQKYSSADQASAEGFLDNGAFEVGVAFACGWLYNARMIGYDWSISGEDPSNGGDSFVRMDQVDGVYYVAGDHPFPENVIEENEFVGRRLVLADEFTGGPIGNRWISESTGSGCPIPLTFFIYLGKCYAYITDMHQPWIGFSLGDSTLQVTNTAGDTFIQNFAITQSFYS